ncbi:hypothetical protein COCHEDRAFT_1031494 [Bipolaris maydis C5]|uniref:Uncharacterized protein n=1 Tax=Cochliobolus heterostrophus (strain C5 / ATCC 48332 / race O) TaxID=701091 RepID=M2UQC6_COCH5|nr:hypothetical protein COCHEDRAFT_1031494 [Bipolaris maydis C5]KAJ6207965.1 hypothetical protein PSV09DRAFT_1031494 [Bipolaris maydis]
MSGITKFVGCGGVEGQQRVNCYYVDDATVGAALLATGVRVVDDERKAAEGVGVGAGAGSKQDVSLTKRGLSRWTGTEREREQRVRAREVRQRSAEAANRRVQTWASSASTRHDVGRYVASGRGGGHAMSCRSICSLLSNRLAGTLAGQSSLCAASLHEGVSWMAPLSGDADGVEWAFWRYLACTTAGPSLIYPKPRAAQFARQRRSQRRYTCVLLGNPVQHN